MITTSYPSKHTASTVAMLGAAEHQRSMLHSHERCQVFGLSPHHKADLTCLSSSSLQELQARNARLCAQALPVMDMLYQQLTHSHSMVLLSDASGVVLHALGDAGFLERAQQVALAPGAVWSEAAKGTNAVGTALMNEAPTVVNGQDHYLREFHFLTCSAAPIFDHKGALLGVINVSGDRRSYHPHTLALATLSARLIENQWFNDQFRQSLRLHIHPQAFSLGTLQEGVLALDEAGRVLGANRCAIEMLGESATQLRRNGLQSLFGTDLEQLLVLSKSQPEQPLQLTKTGGATQVHASLSLGRSQLERSTSRVEAQAAAPQGTADLSAAAAHTELGSQHIAVTAPGPCPVSAIAAKPDAGRIEPSMYRASVPQAHRPGNEAASLVSLRQTELQAIQAAVRGCHGNLALAARQLGIGRSTLYRKLKGTSDPA
ncbi:GAF domain-containing protein [Paucibacter sp. AS339]|uniref:GAF domain-containing protein n=1 Tax=Paucibacter hankyongi TaxID=3133434 RepID=UPI0030ACA8C7